MISLQEYLGKEYQVTETTHEDGKISFNVKRDDFEYTTMKYHPNQLKLLTFISMIGLTVTTKYGSYKFLKTLN